MPLADALERLLAHDRGVLCTVHPGRGVDAVPAVYATDGTHVGVPIDRVKPKSSTRLQRERNLEADPRATLLVDHWDRDDWSRLWWVRAELRWIPEPGEREEVLAALLIERFPQYHRHGDTAPFEKVLVFDLVDVVGWSAGA